MHALVREGQRAAVNAIDAALFAYAEKLTVTPKDMTEADIIALRKLGLDDRAIHDATQVIAYFNYINRVADALGVEPETFVQKWG